jgi:F-type H+-transporting ATPase subunit epsilon
MELTIVVPDAVVSRQQVTSIVAPGADGSFGVKPRHIDMTTVLSAGLLVYERPDGTEGFVACDRGVLVKVGGEVRVTVRRAVEGDDLEELERLVAEVYREVSHEERQAKQASNRLEASFVRRFLEFQDGE